MNSHDEHYSAHLLHFAALHWEELDSRRDDVSHEYSLLSEAELCLCGTKWELGGEPAGSGPRNPSGRTPNSLRLDFLTAYSALPMRWKSRTEVFLLTHGCWPDKITYLRQRCDPCRAKGLFECEHSKFWACHRRRITIETAALTTSRYSLASGASSTQTPHRPQDALPERGSVWEYMARYLHPECRCFGEKAA